jgi:hypothetical protein
MKMFKFQYKVPNCFNTSRKINARFGNIVASVELVQSDT